MGWRFGLRVETAFFALLIDDGASIAHHSGHGDAARPRHGACLFPSTAGRGGTMRISTSEVQ